MLCNFRSSLTLLGLGIFMSALAWGQGGRGSISGLITDESGSVIAGATVKAENSATGIGISSVTTGAGLYSFTSLTPGSYRVTATQPGFQTATQENVTVTVDQAANINFSLHPGAVSTVVTVSDAAAAVDTSSTTVGQLIASETIQRVPLVSRNVYQLAQLSGGVAPTNGTANASETQAVYNARPGANISSYTINGALGGSLYYMLDGSPISIAENNVGVLIPAFQIPLDAVQEFRVETQDAPATYQSGGAGVISLVTKSGTNQLHGSGFVYIRPNAFAANDTFVKANQLANGLANQPLEFHRYQEGGSISGPILRNKLFFFGDYEATQQETVQTGSYTVPTAAERRGDFSGSTITVYNPFAADLPSGQRQPFPGNVIPQSLQDPIGTKVAQLFPSANQAGSGVYHLNNYFAAGLDPNNGQKFDVRLDHYWNEKLRLFGRFSFDREKFGNANLYGSSNIYDPYYYQNITNNRNVMVGTDYSLSNSTILQLRYSFTRHFENQTGDPRQLGFDITSMGFPASLAAEQTYHDVPFFSFGNTSGLGTQPWTVFQFASMQHDITASLATTKGKHDLTFGFEFQKLFMNEGQPVAPSGWYSFDDTATSSTTFAGDGSDLASLLLGMGSAPGYESSNFSKDIFGAQSNPYYALFVQDNFHVSPKLTLNLGLRWDIFVARNERYNRLEYFDPSAQYTANGVSLTGGERFVKNGGSSSTTNWRDFSPRIGMAYQLTNRLLMRGGFGIYYGPSPQMIANSALNSDGFYPYTSWLSSSYNANGNTVMLNPLSNPFPNGVVQATGSSLGPATAIGLGLSTVLRSQPTPVTYSFNFGFQYQLPKDYTVSAAWVGSRALHLPLASEDLNQLPLATISQYGAALNTPVPNRWAAALPPTSAFYGMTTVPQWLALEPYPQFSGGSINGGVSVQGYPGGDSIYHSLQLKVQKRLSRHFTMLASYTWGKLITDDFTPPISFIWTQGVTYQNRKNMNLERSISPQDLSNQFSLQASYDLPIGHDRLVNLNGWSNRLLGGWTLNAIAYVSSGVPIGSPSGTGDPFFHQRVDLTCDPGSGAAKTAAQWLNWNCFSQPASKYLPGTAPAFLTHVRTQGGQNLDLSVFKNFALTERMQVQIEAAAYNITNRAQLGYPSIFWHQHPTADNMAGFGQITNTVNTPRQLQFAAKFTF